MLCRVDWYISKHVSEAAWSLDMSVTVYQQTWNNSQMTQIFIITAVSTSNVVFTNKFFKKLIS
jgi:hypothetical protein